MSTILLKGNEIHTNGPLPQAGSTAADFVLTKTDLTDVTLNDFKGQRLVLNVFPSVDTPVCAASVRHFNQKASGLKNTKVLCVSKDLPFAHGRFCGAEGIENVISVSDLRKNDFGDKYGLKIIDGPLEGLFSRAVIILDEEKKVIYTEQVPEITQEPDYDAAIKALG